MHLLLFHLFTLVASTPLPDPSEVGIPCGHDHPDCPTLTCVPTQINCTFWKDNWFDGCPGTCQEIDITRQHIYTLCGGWGLMDDCDERIEYCRADPRHHYECGPSCDGMGICVPNHDGCGGKEEIGCGEGKVCFATPSWQENAKDCVYREVNGQMLPTCYGVCLPLRFGSDTYAKTGREEIMRNDQDGRQGGYGDD
ncbi:hypothetical protein OQA88_1737 [Cercophora sp. LCS_1]